jgi:hypothetical protein
MAADVEAKKEMPPEFGDSIYFIAHEIPIAAQAQMALKAAAVKPANPRKFIADWIDDHLDQHIVAAKVECGNQQGGMQRLVTDPFLGMIQLMRDAADKLEARYNEINKPKIETRDV